MQMKHMMDSSEVQKKKMTKKWINKEKWNRNELGNKKWIKATKDK